MDWIYYVYCKTGVITINVQLILKMREIIFFCGQITLYPTHVLYAPLTRKMLLYRNSPAMVIGKNILNFLQQLVDGQSVIKPILHTA
jgi:hypothetical protein